MINKNKKPMRSVENAKIRELQAKVARLTTKVNTPFANAGDTVGSYFGKNGRKWGRYAGGVIGKIFGSGDYTTNFNDVSSNAMLNSGPPGFTGGPGADVTTITHREFIGDVKSSTVFTIASYPLNPGQSTTYPWLGPIADNFEEYKILGQVFEFKSTSGDSLNSTNTALGTVIMATQYDASKPAFVNKQQMENYEFCTSCKPSQSFLHAIECKPSLNVSDSLYVRTDSQVAGTDIRFTDFGNFYIATQGMQAADVIIGELWVSYKVQLRKPRLSLTSIASPAFHYSGDNPGSAIPFGTLVYQQGTLATVPSGTTLNIASPVMGVVYYLSIYWSGASGNPIPPTFSLTNATGVNYFENATQSVERKSGITVTYSALLATFTATTASAIVVTLGTGGTILPTGKVDVTLMALESVINH